MHVHGPHTTALGVDRAQRFTQRGAISNDLWHDEAFKQRNLAVKHKKERAAHAKHVKGRAKRGLAMLRMTAKEIGSKVAMEHQLCTLHPPQHTVLRLWAVWLSLAAVVLRYTDASVHPAVLPLRTAALYRETDETSLFEEDWAQMSIVRLASSEEEMLEIQKVLLEHYHTLRELYRVYSNAMGSNHTASAEAFNLSLNEFTSFCHDCRIGHGLIRSVPVPRVFRQAVMGVGGHDAVLASTPGPSSRHSSDGGSGSGGSTPLSRQAPGFPSMRRQPSRSAALNNNIHMKRHVRWVGPVAIAHAQRVFTVCMMPVCCGCSGLRVWWLRASCIVVARACVVVACKQHFIDSLVLLAGHRHVCSRTDLFTMQDVPPISSTLLQRLIVNNLQPRFNRMSGDNIRTALHGRKVRGERRGCGPRS